MCLYLAELLLSRGADPNAQTPSLILANILLIKPSICTFFTLTICYAVFIEMSMIPKMHIGRFSNDLRDGRIRYVKILLRTGIDLKSVCRIWIKQSQRHEYRFALALSLLSLMHLSMRNCPELIRFHEIFVDKGARYYRRCLEMKGFVSLSLGLKEPDYELLVSDEESEEFFVKLERICSEHSFGYLLTHDHLVFSILGKLFAGNMDIM